MRERAMWQSEEIEEVDDGSTRMEAQAALNT